MNPQTGSARTTAYGVGVVVIGRNEGARLRCCLSSVEERKPGVYIDSGSSDGSAALARALGWDVVELDPALPFTAARGRNAGFDYLLGQHNGIRYVQFVDGDCELVAGWLDGARQALDSRPDVAIVAGQLHERDAHSSIYRRLCDMEWHAPAGDVASCGGIFMARAEAFAGVGGFDPSIEAGEEPELCLRLRERGWRIVRLAQAMAWHDSGMCRFGQWWRRAVRSGRGLARGTQLHGHGRERHCVRQVFSALFWGHLLPIFTGMFAIALLWVPWVRAPLLLIALAYGVLWTRIYLHRRRLSDARCHAALYAAFCILSKVPTSLGIASSWWRRHGAWPARPRTSWTTHSAKAGPEIGPHR